MRFSRTARSVVRTASIVGVLGSALLLSSSQVPFTRHQKAFYADPNLVGFVRPGLVVQISPASITADGTIRAQVSLTDPKGLPLDRQGVTTPGPVNLTLFASYIPAGQADYVAYTTRTETSSDTGATAVQPAVDVGGTFQEVGPGQYTYTFATKAPANFDTRATTTVGVWASRDLSEFDLGTNFASTTFSFVPNGGSVTDVHDVVRAQTCQKCHESLDAHGGIPPAMETCILCHTQDAKDADTGNSIRLNVMIHKIHDAAALPSVQGGTPYEIVGDQLPASGGPAEDQETSDYSTIVFPADLPGEGARNCQFCHESGPAQASRWLMKPTRSTCGSCHDNVNFATGENHVNLPQIDDNQCTNCHFPQGELPFDTSIIGAHTLPRFAPGLPGVVLGLVRVDNGTAGKAPTITFTLKDKSGSPLLPSQMNLLNLTVAGPTTDYASYFTEDARSAQGSNGTYAYTFQRTIDANATGTYSVGIEGYRNVTLLPGTTKQQVVRDVGQNQVIDFSADGSPVKAHAEEVTTQNCNACHFQLAAHGTIRNEVKYCLLCHNPNSTDASQRPADQMPPQTIDLPVLVHRIHTGEDQESPYVVFGFGQQPVDFSELRYPGDRRDCAKCHVNDSQQMPLPDARLNVVNPRGFINPEGPITAACTGCHTTQSAAAHALTNTSTLFGESCTVCHSATAAFSVDKMHATP